MSWREFILTLRGRRKADAEQFLKDSILVREVAYQVYTSIPLKKGRHHAKKKKYWPHPWDKEDDDREFEQMKASMEALRAKATQNAN